MNPQDHLAEARRISFDQTGQCLSNPETLFGPSNPFTNNNGGDTDYYKVPSGASMLQDLIEYKDMSWNQANIFKAAYRLGDSHSSVERDLNKIIWFANRMLQQLSKDHNA